MTVPVNITGTNSYLNTLYLSWTPENYQLKIVYLVISSVSSPKLQHQPTQKKFTIFRKLKTSKRICFNSLWHYHAIHKIHFCWTKKLTYSTKITTNITYNCNTITFKTLQKRFYADLTCYIFFLTMVFGPKVSMNLINKPKKQQTFSAIIATLFLLSFPTVYIHSAWKKQMSF